jgi:hypothetical protein
MKMPFTNQKSVVGSADEGNMLPHVGHVEKLLQELGGRFTEFLAVESKVTFKHTCLTLKTLVRSVFLLLNGTMLNTLQWWKSET